MQDVILFFLSCIFYLLPCKSHKKFQFNSQDDDDEVPLDLHDHEPKEALHQLRLHLTSFSGISGRSMFSSMCSLIFRRAPSVLWFKSFVELSRDQNKDKKGMTYFVFYVLSAYKYLRVIVGTSDEDTTKGARKRLVWLNYQANISNLSLSYLLSGLCFLYFCLNYKTLRSTLWGYSISWKPWNSLSAILVLLGIVGHANMHVYNIEFLSMSLCCISFALFNRMVLYYWLAKNGITLGMWRKWETSGIF